MEDNKNFIGSNAKYICMSGVERRMRTKERTKGSGGGGGLVDDSYRVLGFFLG